MRGTLAATVIGASALVALAQDAPPAAPPDPRPAVRTLYKEMEKASDEHSNAKEGAEERLWKKYMAAYEKFGSAFVKTEWSAWDQPDDADLLARGVDYDAQKGFDARDFARAKKGWEFLLEKMPQNSMTGHVVANKLAPLYGASGDFEGGIARMRGAIEVIPATATAEALTALGDLVAVTSDFDEAKKVYAEATAACAKMDAKYPALREAQEKFLKLRARVGEQVADVSGADSATGKPLGLAAHAAGKPVVCILIVMDMFPNDQVVNAASVVKRYPNGVAALGVTNWELLGPMTKLEDTIEVEMPRNPTDDGGQTVKVTRDTMKKHLETYRQRMKAGFPMIVTTDTALNAWVEWPRSAVLVLDAERRLVRFSDTLDFSGYEWMTEALAVRAAGPPAEKK
jgi:tetratricopeptide (TPR) repeat protein